MGSRLDISTIRQMVFGTIRSDGPSTFFGSYSKYKRRMAERLDEEAVSRIEAMQQSDAVSIDFLHLMVAGYLAVAREPATGVPFGLREHRLAVEMMDVLAGTVCAREVTGGPLSIGTQPKIEAGDACGHLKRLIAEEADYKDSIERTLAEVKATRTSQHGDSFPERRMGIYWVLDCLRSRPGYAPCPTCRFEHSFWLKSEKRELCSICLEPSDGVLAPCGHALCEECFGDIKFVPVTSNDLSVMLHASNPEYVEWIRQHHGGETYRSRVLLCRAIVAYYAQHGLCRRCQDFSSEEFEALLREPKFSLEKFLAGADKETHRSLGEYASKLLMCTRKHRLGRPKKCCELGAL